jgi:predicted small secreted protein
MKRFLLIAVALVSLTGCGTTMSGKDVIKSINLAKNASMLSKAGVQESVITKTKDIFDPARGGGKW